MMASAKSHSPLAPLRRSRDGPLLDAARDAVPRAGPPPRPTPPQLFDSPYLSPSARLDFVNTVADEARVYDLEITQGKIAEIQRFISGFDYNYSGKPFVKMNRSLGMLHVTDCARQIISIGLPIQCVEAVFLASVLTAELASPDFNDRDAKRTAIRARHDSCSLDRLPLSFKSKMKSGAVHRHIVLALRYQDKWGALGISRRDTLMYKPLVFDSLGQLIWEYKNCYEKCYHVLLKAYVGLPLPKDTFVSAPIKWRALQLRLTNPMRDADPPTIDAIEEELRCFLDDVLPSQTSAAKDTPGISSNQSHSKYRRNVYSPSLFDNSS